MDDVALVQRAAALDRDAFAGVYERYAARLYDYLWWVLRDAEEAGAALYQTFLEAGSRLHELRDPSKLRPWLFAIASDEALKRHGRQGRRGLRSANGNGAVPHGTFLDDGTDDGTDDGEAGNEAVADQSVAYDVSMPEPHGEWNDLVEIVQRVSADLSPRERALLDLRFRQQLDDEELAEAVGTRADQAASLVAQVSTRVERLLAETVVAFLGRQDCPELTGLLGRWDRLDPVQRAVVEEHAAQCERCGERMKRHIPATALFGVSPAMPVPLDVGERILDQVELAAHTGRPWTARRDGFPPPLIVDRSRRRLAVATAVLVIVLGVGAFLLNRGLQDDQRVASVAATTRPVTTRAAPTTAITVPTTTPSTTVDPSAVAASTLSADAGARAPARASGGGGGSGSDAGGAGDGAPQGTDAGTGGSPDSAAEPATTLPDRTPPSISGPSVSPAVIRPSGRSCANGDPQQATITVTVSDPSGVASVTVSVAGPGGGSKAMTPAGGGSYTATVGPFDSPLPSGVDFPGQVVVQATDGSLAGNTAAVTSGITVRCT